MKLKRMLDGKTVLNVNQIHGFRKPTSNEHSLLEEYLIKEIQRTKRSMIVCLSIYGLLAICMLISSIMRLVSSEERFTGDNIAGYFLTFFFCWLGWVFVKIVLRCNKREQAVRDGEYQVLECKAAYLNYNIENTHGVAVTIVNKVEEYCRQTFVVGMKTAELCKVNMDTPLLLVDCSGQQWLVCEKTLREDKYNMK